MVGKDAALTDTAEVEAYYDPFDFDIDDNPYPVWKRLRDIAPLYRNEKYGFYAGVVSFALPLAVLAGLRSAGLSQPAYDKFPYPTVKVYDPYGHLEEAGKPGPFYK